MTSRFQKVSGLISSLLLVGIAGCGQEQASGPAGGASEPAVTRSDEGSTGAPQSSAPQSSAPQSSAPQSSAPQGSEDANSSPAQSSPPSQTPASPEKEQPKKLNLREGQTANLQHFDVTVLKAEHGKDGISYGVQIKTCYTKAHPGQGADGTTRVSTDPWSLRVRDGESSNPWKWYPVSEFPKDSGWSPEFKEQKLKVGECATGWIPIKHENPDLQWGGVKYAPADFGDVVIWTTR